GFTHIDIADLGIAHLHSPPRQAVRGVRFHRADDGDASCRIHKAETCGRKPPHDKTSEGAAPPFHLTWRTLFCWSKSVMSRPIIDHCQPPMQCCLISET